MKRLLSCLLVLSMVLTFSPPTITYAEINVQYQSQFCSCYAGGSHRVGQCNVASMVNLLRRKAALMGVDANFTIESVYRALGINDAQRTTCTKDGRLGYVYSNHVSGNTSTNRTYVDDYGVLELSTQNVSASSLAQFKSLLDQHPEGVFVGYSYLSGGSHRVLITSYSGNQLYAVDPVYASRGEIPLESIYGYRSDLITNHHEVIVISGSNSKQNVTPPHVHSWTVGYESSHPHKEYRKCTSGCGESEYTGKTRSVTNCKQCYPLGTASLTRSFDKVRGTATFNRNNVINASTYTLTIYKGGSEYNSYNILW